MFVEAISWRVTISKYFHVNLGVALPPRSLDTGPAAIGKICGAPLFEVLPARAKRFIYELNKESARRLTHITTLSVSAFGLKENNK